ncbi:MAG TPA: CBS domain-containing protein [Saprospiraceae bacterium]|nr:CBS domain-containing protein [Saprospiraceae bacterium]WKZ61927.1 MAG: CBS domain-containing protein [Saprospiraceae bacterium]HPB52480.1 CBS domain-containing protein [Saprospiraceae bacterium]HRN34540.1 CBS domain-containing protein [Saprospiraceae bacterium]HRP83731.1 CBS domain-containing protein [Saprospiraceae bacterium]
MFVNEIINQNIPCLEPEQTGEDGLRLMEEYMVRHLPVVKEDMVIGLVSEDMIYDWDTNTPFSEYIFRGYPQVIHHDSHILEAVEVIVKNNLTCVPVTDRNFKYMGLISLQDAFQALSMEFALDEPGAILVLEINRLDYSLTEISRIVESEKGAILSSFISHPLDSDSNLVHVTLKISLQDIQFVKATFERYNYKVVATFSSVEYIDTLAERYDALMHYLNI